MSNYQKTTAQLAAEAIVNYPESFDDATVLAVLTTATAAGVSNTYLDPIRDAWPDVTVMWTQEELGRRRRAEAVQTQASTALTDAERAIGAARLAITEEAEGDLRIAVANLNLASSTLVRMVTTW